LSLRDVELSLIKAQYREAFVAGFTQAIAAMTRRDRNLMRLHFRRRHARSAAQMYGVHRRRGRARSPPLALPPRRHRAHIADRSARRATQSDMSRRP
jgi:hypothetical protein